MKMLSLILFQYSHYVRVLLVCAISLGLPSLVQAKADPFSVWSYDNVYDPPSSSLSVVSGGKSFPDLIQNMVKGQGGFALFNTESNYGGILSYLGVEGAMRMEMRNATGTDCGMTLEIPVIGFSKTFGGSVGYSRDMVYDEVKDFLLKHGSDIYGRFLKEMAKLSAVALTDGNPNSTTAQMANVFFRNEGFTDAVSMVGETSSARFSGMGLGMNGGEFKAGDFKGYYADFGIPFRYNLSDSIGLNLVANLSYLDLEGAKVYGVGLSGALPIRFAIMSKDKRWNWRFSPVAGISVRGSKDMAAGGIIWTVGGVHTVDFRVSRKLILSLVNQISYFNSLAARISSDYKFDPHVDQTMLKNGLRAVTPLTRKILGEVFVIRSDFLKDATIDNFMTYGASVSMRVTQKNNITLAFNYDHDSDYKSWALGLTSVWNF